MGKIRSDRARFGAKLKKLRAMRGDMTQDELARKSGVSVDLIRNYEQGKSFAKDEAIRSLAHALNVSPALFRACKLDELIDSADDRSIYIAAHLMLRMSDAFDICPCVGENFAGVRAGGCYVDYAFCEWADAVEADDVERDDQGGSPVVFESALPHEEWFVLNFNEPPDTSVVRPVELLPERLRGLRKQKALQQDELARKAGISVFSLRSYEQGRRSLNDAHRHALARVFEIAPEALIEFEIADSCAAVHYVFELAYLFGLKPRRYSDSVVVAPRDCESSDGSVAFEAFIREWDVALRNAQNAVDDGDYRCWALRYGLDGGCL